ncbi:uncharacterized protein LOC129720196 [Wyeomyia smithii]|uniref:uncharacterized protein LOC129720196 n=1 Tax=Wyeomyia smithii TaxID=174621 RepID=UPI002467ADB3|nr:uncharacterized protein LOC129720196 [Wyeomyia smithii]
MSHFETPLSTSAQITRRNILESLSGSASKTSNTVPTIAQQKAAQKAAEKHRKMQNNLQILSDRRDLLLDKILRINESLQIENISIHLLRLHLETLRRCAADYEKNYCEMAVLLPKEDRAAEHKEYETFEKLHNEVYVELRGRIAQAELTTKLLETQNVAPANVVAPSNPVYVQTSTPHLQAPFPTFNGDLESWYSFKSLFQSLMARYANESPAMKILYSRNALCGEAKEKIDRDVINNNDYEGAWKILEAAYEDKRLILDTHIDSILDCPKISKENRGRSISKLVDICTKHTDALNGHGFSVDGLAELILVNVIYKKLDKETQEQWEVKIGHDEVPMYDEFIDFLRERGRVLQRTNHSQQQVSPHQTVVPVKRQGFNQKHPIIAAKSFISTTAEVCPCCKEDHVIYKCAQFIGMNVGERKSVVVKERLCFNCLKKHRVSDCPTDQGCKVQRCNRKHHSLLHPNIIISTNISSSGTPPTETPIAASSSTVAAEVFLVGRGGVSFKCRALLDSGSDSNIITEELANKLELRMNRVDLPMSGLNDIQIQVKYLLSTKIVSCVNSFVSSELEFLIVARVTSTLPVIEIDARSLSVPKGITLADPNFQIAGQVDVIIGNEIFFDLIKKGRMKLGGNTLTLAETELGWVSLRREFNGNYDKILGDEHVHSENIMTTAERDVEDHFMKTHSRDEYGRYIVRFPFKDLQNTLGDSYEHALKRLDKLMVSLVRMPNKREEYAGFLTEYLALGHMKEVTHYKEGCYYIPHHAVYKSSSSTTKTRVVFDASAKTTSGVSLNDTLKVGATVQRDLLSVILKFCTHKVVLTADIPKM